MVERYGVEDGGGHSEGGHERPASGLESARHDAAGMDRPRTRKRSISPFRTIWEWGRTLALAVVLVLFARSFVVEAFKIPTSSMEGTLLVGDFLLVNKFVYGAEIPGTELRIPAMAEPRRGEVIVFHPPHEPEKNYVKRIVGVPGDILEMRDKALLVNGSRVDEPYAQHTDERGDRRYAQMDWQWAYLTHPPRWRSRYRPTRDNWGPLRVPSNRYFVLGDNRDNSEDSRFWGFVSRESITGRPWFVYYSFDLGDPEPFSWIQTVRWDRIGDLID